MIFNLEKVNDLKAENTRTALKTLKVNMGIAGAFGCGIAASAASLNIPLATIASIGFISKLPVIINGFKYLSQEASTVIPEYRFMLKNKKTSAIYENQFASLVKSYVEDSNSLIEKRFKMEFLNEWLHARDIHMRELKTSGLCEYSINLKNNIKKYGLNEDAPLENKSMDAGVVFTGICENDDYAKMQRDLYMRDFIKEGIVGSLLIKGASEDNVLEFLSLQDYKLTDKDKDIINEFLNMSDKEYLSGVKADKYCSVEVNENTVSLIDTGLKMNSSDGKEIADLLFKVCQKAEKSRLLYMKENPGKAENPVSTHRSFTTDMILVETSLNKPEPSKAKLRLV